MKISKKLLGTVVLGAALLAAPALGHQHDAAAAAKTYLGVDWAKYQGANGIVGPNDEFAIVQIGGTYNGSISVQNTYSSQVASAKKQGLRGHTYIWYQVGSSTTVAKKALDYFLPKVKTPKGSIVALDYEDGATSSKSANTAAIMYGMKRVKDAGYTPLLYSGQYYLNDHVDMKTLLKTYPNSLWVARYADYSVTPKPNFNYFPSMDGVAMWQYTSTQVSGGLDGNVDLTGVSFNGYKSTSTSTSTNSKTLVQSSYRAVGVVASGSTGYTYSTSKGMVAGAKLAAGNWKTLTKGVINGKTYYSVSKDGKATYAWVPAANIKFGVKATTPAAMTQSSYKAVGTVSATAKTYYYTSKGMITGPKVAAGNWKTLTKGVYNGNTYYLVSKDGKSGYAWVLASGIKFGVKATTPAAMTQSSYKAVGTVSVTAKTYYYTSKGMITGPKVAAGNWKTLTKGVYNGNTYYLVSKDGKKGYAWVLASGIKFGVKAGMSQSAYPAKGIVKASTKFYYYVSSGMIAGPKVTSGIWKTMTKGVYNGNTYYLLTKDGKKGYAWVPASGITFGLK